MSTSLNVVSIAAVVLRLHQACGDRVIRRRVIFTRSSPASAGRGRLGGGGGGRGRGRAGRKSSTSPLLIRPSLAVPAPTARRLDARSRPSAAAAGSGAGAPGTATGPAGAGSSTFGCIAAGGAGGFAGRGGRRRGRARGPGGCRAAPAASIEPERARPSRPGSPSAAIDLEDPGGGAVTTSSPCRSRARTGARRLHGVAVGLQPACEVALGDRLAHARHGDRDSGHGLLLAGAIGSGLSQPERRPR